MKLYINTKDSKLVEVGLKEGNKWLDKIEDHNNFGSQVLLPLIDQILMKNNLKFQDLKEIEVENGPGSFVGLRVGVSVANALAYCLKIPVNGKKLEIDLRYN